jgi:hypothetical protein
MLSEVLRAGRASTAGLSPLSTPDSILIRYRKGGKASSAVAGLVQLSLDWYRQTTGENA